MARRYALTTGEAFDGSADNLAALHYQHAPVYMQKTQRTGIAGKDAVNKGAIIPSAEGEGLMPIWAAKAPFEKAGRALNTAALRDWFVPRYQAWKAEPTKAVTVAEVAVVMASDFTWLQPAAASPKA